VSLSKLDWVSPTGREGDGALFFFSYLVFYAIWALAGGSPISLRAIFLALHLFWAAVAVLSVRKMNLSRSDVLFWSGLALLFLLPGVYLEFPSDPWEHFRRTTSWEMAARVAWSGSASRFPYFWNWTFLHGLSPNGVRLALDGLGAFWQLWLCGQFYRTSRAFGFEAKWARLATLVFLATFGNSVFGLRYYALSPILLSLGAYLALLRWACHPSWRRAAEPAVLPFFSR
jgi:hypothetical protein